MANKASDPSLGLWELRELHFALDTLKHVSVAKIAPPPENNYSGDAASVSNGGAVQANSVSFSSE